MNLLRKKKTWVAISAASFSLIILVSCGTPHSKVAATDQVDGKSVGYWYQTLSFNDGDPYNFLTYHKTNKDQLMGNAAGDLLPETLKGVWFMDGNPLSDKTIEFTKVAPSTDGADFKLRIDGPATFSWTNLPKSYKLNKLATYYADEYEVKFLDCPEDVKKERETMWGMKDGSCTKADHQFATITPYFTLAGHRSAIPSQLAYFDFYLRPKVPGQDYYIWERRTKLFKFIDDAVSFISNNTHTGNWSRYKFTQIIDKDANALMSYPHFIDSLKDFATQNKIQFETMLWIRCFPGADGCDKQHLENGESQVNITNQDEATNVSALPIL